MSALSLQFLTYTKESDAKRQISHSYHHQMEK